MKFRFAKREAQYILGECGPLTLALPQSKGKCQPSFFSGNLFDTKVSCFTFLPT